jgi:predicted RNase H-like nuclease (RuvC/YqgF family)
VSRIGRRVHTCEGCGRQVATINGVIEIHRVAEPGPEIDAPRCRRAGKIAADIPGTKARIIERVNDVIEAYQRNEDRLRGDLDEYKKLLQREMERRLRLSGPKADLEQKIDELEGEIEFLNKEHEKAIEDLKSEHEAELEAKNKEVEGAESERDDYEKQLVEMKRIEQENDDLRYFLNAMGVSDREYAIASGQSDPVAVIKQMRIEKLREGSASGVKVA